MWFEPVDGLPVARIQRAPRARVGLAIGALHAWLFARWAWFRPRTAPAAIAVLCTLAVMKSVSYLSHLPPDPATAPPTGAQVIGRGPPAATIEIHLDRGLPIQPGRPGGTARPDASRAVADQPRAITARAPSRW